MSSRLIAYGDIHGCLDELKELRDILQPTSSDIEVSLGDIINKGPYSIELIAYLKQNGIQAILGNHEDKFLRYKAFVKTKTNKSMATLSNVQKELYSKLSDNEFEYLHSMKHFMNFGAVTLLHGGVTGYTDLNNAKKKDLALIMHVRYLDKNLKFIAQDEKSKAITFWSESYDGRFGLIVYGHQPFLEPKIDKFALGIDTGCVYGNKLTAAVFELKDGVVLNPDYKIVSVAAKKNYEKKPDFKQKK